MNEGFNVIAQGDTRFDIMAVERMKSVKDTSVRHMLVDGPSGRRFRDDGCFINQHLLIGGIQCGEDLKLWLRLKEERGAIICLLRVTTKTIVVEALALFTIAE
ncbi:unnamed protein product [Prunus armeniaca]